MNTSWLLLVLQAFNPAISDSRSGRDNPPTSGPVSTFFETVQRGSVLPTMEHTSTGHECSLQFGRIIVRRGRSWTAKTARSCSSPIIQPPDLPPPINPRLKPLDGKQKRSEGARRGTSDTEFGRSLFLGRSYSLSLPRAARREGLTGAAQSQNMTWNEPCSGRTQDPAGSQAIPRSADVHPGDALAAASCSRAHRSRPSV